MKRTLIALAVLTAIATPAGAGWPEEDNQTCLSMGLKFGTPDYVQCRQQLIANKQEQTEHVRQGLFGAGAAMQHSGGSHATCVQNGNVVNCSSD